MFASPRRTRFGIFSGRDSAMCPSVFRLLEPLSAELYHRLFFKKPPPPFRSYIVAGLQTGSYLIFFARASEFFSHPSLLYSVTHRLLNYSPFACVVQGNGGLPWPRTAIPGEFPSSSPLSSSRSALSFSYTTGVRPSIRFRFS